MSTKSISRRSFVRILYDLISENSEKKKKSLPLRISEKTGDGTDLYIDEFDFTGENARSPGNASCSMPAPAGHRELHRCEGLVFCVM